MGEPRTLKPRANRKGYLYVNLAKNGRYKSASVHRLVAKAFLADYDDGLQVNHKDGNKTNNSLQNLEMLTNAENIHHAFRTGLIPTKLSLEAKQHIRNQFGSKTAKGQLAREYNVNRATIYRVLG